MSMTPSEVISVLKGTASEDLQERFLAEEASMSGEVMRMLRAAELWAQIKFSLKVPSPVAKVPPMTDANPGLLMKKAAVWNKDSLSGDQPPVGAKELVAFLRGTATAETSARVQDALSDPSSEVSRLLRELEDNSR